MYDRLIVMLLAIDVGAAALLFGVTSAFWALFFCSPLLARYCGWLDAQRPRSRKLDTDKLQTQFRFMAAIGCLGTTYLLVVAAIRWLR
jgi:hypothetical protein